MLVEFLADVDWRPICNDVSSLQQSARVEFAHSAVLARGSSLQDDSGTTPTTWRNSWAPLDVHRIHRAIRTPVTEDREC